MKCPHCEGRGSIDSVIHLPQGITASIWEGRVVGYDRLPDLPIPTGYTGEGVLIGSPPPTFDLPIAEEGRSPLEEEAQTKKAQREADNRN